MTGENQTPCAPEVSVEVRCHEFRSESICQICRFSQTFLRSLGVGVEVATNCIQPRLVLFQETVMEVQWGK